MQEVLLNMLKDLLYAIVVVVVPILAKYITSYIKSKRESILSSKDTLLFDRTISNALEIIQRTVDMVSQTYVNTLKEKGTFDEEAQKEAFKRALETSKSLLSSDAKIVLNSLYGDLDSWLQVQIESYILDNKKIQG